MSSMLHGACVVHISTHGIYTWVLYDGCCNRFAYRGAHLFGAFSSLYPGARGMSGGVFHWLPLVMVDRVPGVVSRADVFCHCGLPSLFLSSLVQNQPCLPIHHGCLGHDLHAAGSPLVAGDPLPPPPRLRHP